MKEHKYIIFCDEHYNPLGAIRSLGEIGIRPDAIIIKNKLKISSSSKYLDRIYYVKDHAQGYKLLLEKYGNSKSEQKPFIITCDDKATSYLDMHYDEIKDKFYFNNAGSTGRITEYMNKYNINSLAEKHGLKVLNNMVTDLGNVPDNFSYPLITKSISSILGGWKDDVFICQNENELKNAFDKIKSPQILLQKYVEKKNELCLDGFAFNKGKDIFISIASTYDYIIPGTYSSYMTIKNFRDTELYNILKAIFAEIGFEGIFSVEFLIDKFDNLYFLEINFRNSTWSYASTCAGMNLLKGWTYSMLHGKLPENFEQAVPKNYKAVVEISDFKQRVLNRRISLIQWVKEIKQADCKFYYNHKDPKPFWTSLFSKLGF